MKIYLKHATEIIHEIMSGCISKLIPVQQEERVCHYFPTSILSDDHTTVQQNSPKRRQFSLFRTEGRQRVRWDLEAQESVTL